MNLEIQRKLISFVLQMRILIVAYLVEVVVLLCRHKQYIFICNFFFQLTRPFGASGGCLLAIN